MDAPPLVRGTGRPHGRRGEAFGDGWHEPLGDGATRDRRLVRATPMGMGVVRRRRRLILSLLQLISVVQQNALLPVAQRRLSPSAALVQSRDGDSSAGGTSATGSAVAGGSAAALRSRAGPEASWPAPAASVVRSAAAVPAASEVRSAAARRSRAGPEAS